MGAVVWFMGAVAVRFCRLDNVVPSLMMVLRGNQLYTYPLLWQLFLLLYYILFVW